MLFHISKVALAILLASNIVANLFAQEQEKFGPIGQVELVADGFQFLEGPAKTPDGSLYFTDIPANAIHKLSRSGKIELWQNASNHANGLMYGGDGRLLACEMDGQLVAYNLADGKRSVLVETYKGTRFNACNDLVIDRQGGIYFTDPRYRAPDPWPQKQEAFYYLPNKKGSKAIRLDSGFPAPNGIILSPDEKTLYVIPSMQSKMLAYQIKSPGALGERRVFCELKQPEGEDNTGGDGLAIDVSGNLYITAAAGVQVFSPAGKYLTTITVPQKPANCSFGGADNKTLYITARTGLYRCQMPIAGHQFRTE